MYYAILDHLFLPHIILTFICIPKATLRIMHLPCKYDIPPVIWITSVSMMTNYPI